MHAHTTRSVRGRRVAARFLLPAIGLGLLTACSSGVSAERSDGSDVIEEIEAGDSAEQTCERWQGLMTKLEVIEDVTGAGFDALDEDDFEGKLPIYREYGESYHRLAAEYSDLADDAGDQQLAEAIHELEYVLVEMGNNALAIADVDLTSEDAFMDAAKAIRKYELGYENLINDEDVVEADNYIYETCSFHLGL